MPKEKQPTDDVQSDKAEPAVAEPEQAKPTEAEPPTEDVPALAQPQAAAAVAPLKKRGNKQKTIHFKPAEYERNIFRAVTGAGVNIVELLDPAYWRDVAVNLKPLDRIEINPEDGAYWAEVLVLSCSRTEAIVQTLRYVELDQRRVARNETSGYRVEWGGPVAKNRVIRLKDNRVLQDGFDLPEQAHTWLSEHLKAVAA